MMPTTDTASSPLIVAPHCDISERVVNEPIRVVSEFENDSK
jgi:hypothetical protein